MLGWMSRTRICFLQVRIQSNTPGLGVPDLDMAEAKAYRMETAKRLISLNIHPTR